MPHNSASLTAFLAVVVSAVAVAAAKPHTTTKTATATVAKPSQTLNACAQVAQIWTAENSPLKYSQVPASLAHDCLTSVPINSANAIRLLDTLVPYLEWQSTTQYLANPPRDYYYPAYDIFANLAEIKRNVQNGKYANEYDFQTDLYLNVSANAHDGHFLFSPDAVGNAFEFVRPTSLSLVSVSEDSSSLPVIKLRSEVLSNSTTASTVDYINGVKASTFLQQTVDAAGINQDADAAYNAMFSTTAAGGSWGGFVNSGRSSLYYSGSTTNVTFANGTTLTVENVARVTGNFSTVKDGASFYRAFCIPRDASGKVIHIKDGVLGEIPNGYPNAVVETPDDFGASGYYLAGKGLEDVAVLIATTFDTYSSDFQATVQEFLAKASADGKKKLIVDLQTNQGGQVLLAYDFFRQLFPNVLQDGFSHFKDSAGFHAVSKAISDKVANLDISKEKDGDLIEAYNSWFNYRADLNITNQPFLTFDDKFSPQEFHNTNFTPIYRFNLSNPYNTINPDYGLGIEISGYGTRANLTQHFKAENIVVISDGFCASACTVAAEMLRVQTGVKFIALGGRPIAGPMQAIGGTKGSQILDMNDLQNFVTLAAKYTKDPALLAEFRRYSAYPLYRSVQSTMNVRDQILRHDLKDEIAAQFVYQPADCHLFWSTPMIANVTAIWEASAHAAFNGAKCAHGGFGAQAAKTVGPPGSAIAYLQTNQAVSKRGESISRSRGWLARHQQKVTDVRRKGRQHVIED